jgi:putative membrane protein
MKRLLIALVLIACACRSRESATSTDTVSTSGTETTGTVSKTSTGSSGGTASSLSEEDKKFFVAAARTNSLELAMSRNAADEATKPDVKSFAVRMIADHGQIDHELQQLALSKGVALPKPAAAPTLSNVDFDHAYTLQMMLNLEREVAEFESANVKDPDLRAWAAKTLPLLREHRATAKRLSGS